MSDSRDIAPAPHFGLALLLAWVGPAALVTLYPVERAVASVGFHIHGVAQVLASVALFIPFGAGLRLRGWRPAACLLAGFLASACIEAAQTGIDGRDPAAQDLVTNAFGAWLGAGSAGFLHLTRNPRDTTIHVSLAALLPVGVVLLTGLLLNPKLTTIPWSAEWTPEHGHLAHYDGRVTAARLGPEALPPGPLPHHLQVRELLLRGERLRVEAVAGTRPRAIAPLVDIIDENREESLMLGVDGEDLVLRRRTVAARFRLHHPTLRAYGALAGIEPGDRLVLEAWWTPDGLGCVRVNGQETCGLGASPGDGWTLLHYPQKLALKLGGLLGLAWMALLFFPLAYWTRWKAASGIAWLGAFAGVTVAVLVTPLRGPALFEVLGALVGSVVGIYVARAVRDAERGAHRWTGQGAGG